MLPGPIFWHELRVAARRKRTYALRVLLGLFLLYSVVMAYEAMRYSHLESMQVEGLSPNELARLGGNLFSAVVWIQSLAICCLTPAFLASSIAEERQRKVLSYLLASPLTGVEIVLGKLAARLINLAILVMAGLPVVCLALLFGGTDPQVVLLAYAASFSALFFLSAISILISVYTTKPRDAILMAYLVVAGWIFYPLVESILIQIRGPLGGWLVAARSITEWITDTSPMSLPLRVSMFSPGQVAERVSWMIGLQLLYGTLMMGWATIRLRPIERESGRWGWRLLRRGGGIRRRRLHNRRPCGDDPMIWKECTETVSVGGPAGAATLALLVLAAIGGLAYLIWELGIPALREMLVYGTGSEGTWTARRSLNIVIRIITACVYIITGLMLGATASAGITTEYEKDTWTSLVSTPLEGREIFRAKVLGAFYRVRFPLAALILVWVTGACCGAVHPLGLITAVAATGIYTAFIAIFGTFMSLRFKSSARAIAMTVGLLIFISGGYLFCCMPLLWGEESTVVLAGFSPLIVTSAPFTADELDSFFSSSYPGSMDFRARAIVMAIISLAGYGMTAFAFWITGLQQFEVVVDRPRRSMLFPRRDSDPRGITFIEDAEPDEPGLSQAEGSGPVTDD